MNELHTDGKWHRYEHRVNDSEDSKTSKYVNIRANELIFSVKKDHQLNSRFLRKHQELFMFLVKIKVILSRHSVVRFKSSMQKTYSIHHNSPCILSNRAEIVPLIYILDAVYAQEFSGLQHLLWLRSSRGETYVVYCISVYFSKNF